MGYSRGYRKAASVLTDPSRIGFILYDEFCFPSCFGRLVKISGTISCYAFHFKQL